ncbi:MaoC/PaaZ C-terminal domain-containing protein [Arthrobacter sp. OV608]|uniref:MaoC/PaaZ C-terminal domain-containing protein n=1 Tax=Arthrobacter sp. OV608 TaxID=1882768 RepID=UPI0008BEA6F7|nr:MaoC/PaaZ C-terminal domain-containing protein [Arthrobacter sp. OV608]SER13825.1 Acyl dehydratase [Arthrobacter sp. OV608]
MKQKLTTHLLGTTNESAVRYLEELDLGQQWTSAGRTVTEFDVVTFATWSGDMHPLHTNEEYAKTTEFGTRLFHGPGALSIAFGLEMALGWKNGSAIAFLGINNWNLCAPIRIGDTISVREEVIGIKPSASKPDRGIVTTRVQILNQDGVICQEGDWIVLLSRRPA